MDKNEILLQELNSLYAEEIQAWYQYFVVKEFLVGNERASVQKSFEVLADDELNDHAVKLLKRINELSGEVYATTLNSVSEFALSEFKTSDIDVGSQLGINIEGEEEAIEHYKEVIKLAEDNQDYTTSEILKEILADEEEHLTELQDYLNDMAL